MNPTNVLIITVFGALVVFALAFLCWGYYRYYKLSQLMKKCWESQGYTYDTITMEKTKKE